MFGEFKTDLLVWISSILDHWGALATGGVIVGILQLLKDRYPQYFSWSSAWKVAAVFLTFSVFQSWQQEYKSKLGREKDLLASNHVDDSLRQEFRYQSQKLSDKCEAKDSVNLTLQAQNRGQQATINGCLSQAMKLLSPEPLKITPLVFDNDVNDPNLKKVRWLVLTNRIVTPVQMNVACDQDVERGASVWIVGAGILGGGVDRIAPRVLGVNIATPAWSPISPLLVSMSYKGSNNIACSFAIR